MPRRQVAAAVAGNALEFYDFTAYAFFAVQIGRSFFPAHTPFASLMLTLATFGAGFVTRPLGAIVIGAFGDHAGRRPAMLLSFGLMGAAAAGLALTPSYAAIGPVAALLVLFARLVQGFALGGEVGPVTAFLIEASPRSRRGLFGAWQVASQGVATLTAGLIGLSLSNLLDAGSLQAWGWRVAFLLGAAILPVGLWLRLSLPETLHAPAGDEASPVGRARVVVLGLGLIMSATTATYTLNYMNTYAVTVLHMKANLGFAATAVTGGCGLVFAVLGGALSDRIGRRPVMIWPAAALLAAAWPAYALIGARRDAIGLLAATGVMSALLALSNGVRLVSLAEALPRAGRSAGVSIVYACVVAAFGGTTQLILTWLLHATGQPLAVAWFVMATTSLGLLAALLMPETRPDPAGR
jgi:MFS family permease